MPSPVPGHYDVCECGHHFGVHAPVGRCDGSIKAGRHSHARCQCKLFAAAGSSVPDTSGQPETVEGGDVNVARGGGEPLPSPLRTPEQMRWIHDRFKIDGLERLARSDSDYYESHGYYLPDVAALAHAALLALDCQQCGGAGLRFITHICPPPEWSYGTTEPLAATPVPAPGLPAVREPDEATILREAVSWAHWPVGKPQFHRSDMLAALDRLVADRDRWKWGRDWQAEKATAWAKRCFAAETEVAVLTTRLTEADEALRQIAHMHYSVTGNSDIDLNRCKDIATDALARAALAWESGTP